MLRFVCKAKIHRATLTDKNINYEGSITIDKALLKKADIRPYEKVEVANVNNGQRLNTYVIEGPEGKGDVCLNGAAARIAEIGDKIIILSYAIISEEEADGFKPKLVMVDEKNRPKDK